MNNLKIGKFTVICWNCLVELQKDSNIHSQAWKDYISRPQSMTDEPCNGGYSDKCNSLFIKPKNA
jgi:hypothetical protein